MPLSDTSRRPIILGLWPIAGITTVGVTPRDARGTIQAAIEAGVTAFDTAYSYGYDGESDRLIGEFLRGDRDRFVVIGKVGQRWSDRRRRVTDGSPETLTGDAERSLKRIGVDAFDLLMLHSPDPNVAIEASAEAIDRLRRRGLCRAAGICNANHDSRRRFASVAGCDAIQCPLNLVQPEMLAERIPDASDAGAEVHVYWTLMKGLLAGKITRDHLFAPGDSRPGYDVFQGETRRRVHDAVDELARLGKETGQTVAQLSIGWALSQPGVSAALVGARRPDQIRETAAARRLDADVIRRINEIVARTTARGRST